MSSRWQTAYIKKGDGTGTIAHTYYIHHCALVYLRLTFSALPARSAVQLVSNLSSKRIKRLHHTATRTCRNSTTIIRQRNVSNAKSCLCLCGMFDLDAVNDTDWRKYQPSTPLWNLLDCNKQSDINLLRLLKQNLSRLRLFPLATRFWWWASCVTVGWATKALFRLPAKVWLSAQPDLNQMVLLYFEQSRYQIFAKRGSSFGAHLDRCFSGWTALNRLIGLTVHDVTLHSATPSVPDKGAALEVRSCNVMEQKQ